MWVYLILYYNEYVVGNNWPKFEPTTQQFGTVILANKFESEYIFRVEYGHMKSTWHYSHDVSIFCFI